MVQGSPSPIEGGGDNLLLLQEIFIPPVSSACKAQPLTGEGLGGGELGFIPPSPPSPPARGEDSFEESYFYGKGF